RILLTVVVIFRILIVAIVGETVYEDEQTMFMCNTLQPGCNQACYDQAFPISHIRYWVFQIILVCTPSLCFITYSVHQAAKQRATRCWRRTPARAGRPTASWCTTPGPRPRRSPTAWSIQVVFRNALEIGFLAGQYFLYGFHVPALFECGRYPCVKEVECYVSRPTEKTVFLVFMFAVSGICVLLNLAELNHLGWRKIRAAMRGVQARRKHPAAQPPPRPPPPPPPPPQQPPHGTHQLQPEGGPAPLHLQDAGPQRGTSSPLALEAHKRL
uniref:Gap junction protein n=1 Tax=Pelodiscus sinensis TaxID=13735 RepID=K7GJT1_PELSI